MTEEKHVTYLEKFKRYYELPLNKKESFTIDTRELDEDTHIFRISYVKDKTGHLILDSFGDMKDIRRIIATLESIPHDSDREFVIRFIFALAMFRPAHLTPFGFFIYSCHTILFHREMSETSFVKKEDGVYYLFSTKNSDFKFVLRYLSEDKIKVNLYNALSDMEYWLGEELIIDDYNEVFGAIKEYLYNLKL